VIDFTPEEIASACGARLVSGDPHVSPEDRPRKAVIDSRAAGPGDLFFGLPGEREDGGAFAAAAFDAGAWGAVVTPAHAEAATRRDGARVFATPDPLAALGGLASQWLASLRSGGCRVVGITGSTGKTSTKDILLSMLGPVTGGHAHANPENWNTEIGLPLTVLEAPAGLQLMVLEMAMRGMGQIAELARIAQPDVGVITNIGPVHLEVVGSIDRVAEAKAELIAGLRPGTTCVIPADEEALSAYLRPDVRTITFAPWHLGEESMGDIDADVRALSVEPTQNGLRTEVVAGNERATLDFGFNQAHNITNALAAVGAAHALGISLGALAEGVGHVAFSSLRGEELELPGGVLIVNDCYNANPVSMRAALDHLAQIAARRGASRAVAVLGEMRELGPDAGRYHEEIGRWAAGKAHVLVAVGEFADAYERGYAGAGEVVRAAEAADAADLVRELVREGDVVLVKASRSVGLERVTEALTAESPA
jgi:UDP-N-acetylmuramoyl-tripeptide--D-alanyl-D-alanine ligase